MNISFGDGAHAEYFYNKKLNEEKRKNTDYGVVTAEWEFPDDLYAAAKARMNAETKRPNEVPGGLWNDVKELPMPGNSTDSVVKKNRWEAFCFPSEWIPVINKYCRNAAVRFHSSDNVRGKAYFEGEEAEPMTKFEYDMNFKDAGYRFLPY